MVRTPKNFKDNVDVLQHLVDRMAPGLGVSVGRSPRVRSAGWPAGVERASLLALLRDLNPDLPGFSVNCWNNHISVLPLLMESNMCNQSIYQNWLHFQMLTA
jgi:hypothetical protein